MIQSDTLIRILNQHAYSLPPRQLNELLALHITLFTVILLAGLLQTTFLKNTLSPRTFIRALSNVLIGALIHYCLLLLLNQPITSAAASQNLSLHTFLGKFILGYTFADAMYYTLHRLLHWKYLYRRIHKQHHDTHQSGPLTAMDVHPLEYSFAQMGTELASAWVVGATLPELCVLSSVAKVFAMYSHSRSEGKAWVSVMEHEAHHRDGRSNFGVTGLMDWVFGTMK
ncbi:hypothetical protein AbraIFM66950_004172 [Aspergillus brasiliensis]|nr:hypothetical protein AbraIFM66950_004172 [Aspergillus brasiliensis]